MTNKLNIRFIILIVFFFLNSAFIYSFHFKTAKKISYEHKKNISKSLHAVKIKYVEPDMVLVVGGEFLMGSNNGFTDEKPVHKVRIDSFYIGKYEITIADFKQFIDATSYKTDADKGGWSWIWNGATWIKKRGVNWQCDVGGNKIPAGDYSRPVIHVSWNDAKEYCNWLSKQTGDHYRLPTEAEWEYAAIGGYKAIKTKYSGSNNIDEVAWYAINSDGHPHTVGGKKPNSIGIYDMSGNVWEWCNDWYYFSYYSSCPMYDPQGKTNGTKRVIRGGSWKDYKNYCRISIRGKNEPNTRGILIGFRVVKEI